MGKFDKTRLSLPTQTTSEALNTDLRLKLAKKNQILDARQVLNKKKQQVQQKQQILINKKQIVDDDKLSGGSLIIMKTLDNDTGSEKRLYKVSN